MTDSDRAHLLFLYAGIAAAVPSVVATTAAELAAEVAAGKCPVVDLTLELTARRLDTSTSETLRFFSGNHPEGLTRASGEVHQRGLNFLGYGSRMTGGGKGGLTALLRSQGSETQPAEIVIQGEPRGGDLGGFASQTAKVDGALAAGDQVLRLDGMDANRWLYRGDRFRFGDATEHEDRWFVVLDDTQANGSGVVASLAFWPAIPTGGVADNTPIRAHELGGNSIAPLLAYSLRGASASLYFTGQLEDGSAVKWAEKGTLLSGMEVSTFRPALRVSRQGDRPVGGVLELQLSPPGNRLTAPMARAYEGRGAVPRMSNDARTDGLQYYETAVTRPHDLDDAGATGDLWIQAYCWIPEEIRGNSGKRYVISCGDFASPDTGSWGLFFDESKLAFTGFVHKASVAYSADSPAITHLERFYSVWFEYDKSAQTMRLWLADHSDRDLTIQAGTATTGVPTTGYTAGSAQTTLGARPTGADLWMGMFYVAIGETLPASEQIRDGMITRVITEADGCLATYKDDVSADGTTWFADPKNEAATPQSNWEATEASLGTPDVWYMLEGGAEKKGARPPVTIGLSTNVKMDALAFADRWIYRASELATGKLVAVFDGGEKLTEVATVFQTLMAFLIGATPAAGSYNQWSSLVELGAAPAAEVTCDTHGESLWGTSPHWNGSTSEASVPNGAVQKLGSPSTLMFWLFLGEDLIFNQAVFDCFENGGGVEITYQPGQGAFGALATTLGYVDTGSSPTSATLLTHGADVDLLRTDSFFGRSVHLALVLDHNSGTELQMDIYLNGRQADSVTYAGQLGATSLTGILGDRRFAAGGDNAEMIVMDYAIFDYPMTQAQVQTVMFMPLMDLAAASRPEHYYTEPTATAPDPASTWEDVGETAGQDITLTTDVEWSKPLPVADLLGCTYLVATTRGGVDPTAVDLTAGFDLPDHLRGLPLPGDATVTEALEILRLPEAWLVYAGEYKLQPFANLLTATPVKTLYPADIVRIWDDNGSSQKLEPPWTVGVGFGRVGLVQPGLSAGSTAEQKRAGLVAQEIRYLQRPVPGARDDYPRSTPEDNFPSAYVLAPEAEAAANTLADRLGVAPAPLRVADRDWLTEPAPGSVWKIVHPVLGVQVGYLESFEIHPAAGERWLTFLAVSA